MTLAAVILLLISAAKRAGWNLLGKRQHPTTAFFLVANTLGCLYMAPVLVPYGRALGAVLGLVVLQEPRHLPKALGVVVTFLGLVLVGLG